MSIYSRTWEFAKKNGYRALIVRGMEVVLGVKPLSPIPAEAHVDLGGGYFRQVEEVHEVVHAPELSPGESAPVYDANDVVTAHYRQNQPLRVFTAPGPANRLNLVTDSINAGSLFGGVGTAIILAVQLAKARKCALRVVTRTQVADERGFRQVLKCNGLDYPDNVEFSFVGVNSKEQLDVTEGDRFLTTSWWTTESVLGSIAPSKVDYLLQEDERMFYAHGDEWVRCNEVLKRTDIRYIINTKLLFDHLASDGLPHLHDVGTYFEPAFPESMFYWDDDNSSDVASLDEEFRIPSEASDTIAGHSDDVPNIAEGKKVLFFYARPNNLRNMYYRGLEALDRAIVEGVIDTDEWDIVFVGKDAQRTKFSDGSRATVHQTFAWKEYGEFIRNVDLGFILMSTPHPSYPPLDIASSGGAVVTNKFGLKQDLSGYSKNIVMSGLSIADLVDGIRRGIALSADQATRKQNYANNGIGRNWEVALSTVVEEIK